MHSIEFELDDTRILMICFGIFIRHTMDISINHHVQ